MGGSLFSNGGRAGHILVRRVGAGTNEGNFEFLGPVVLFHFLGELGDWGGEIWGKWSVDMGLQL
jgi:hypothetical protein